jgi:hypothetical protein
MKKEFLFAILFFVLLKGLHCSILARLDVPGEGYTLVPMNDDIMLKIKPREFITVHKVDLLTKQLNLQGNLCPNEFTSPISLQTFTKVLSI